MDGRELYKLTVGMHIEMANKTSPFIAEFKDGAITSLEMMINYPKSYKHSKKINPSVLKGFLKECYACWPLNFEKIYEQNRGFVN